MQHSQLLQCEKKLRLNSNLPRFHQSAVQEFKCFVFNRKIRREFVEMEAELSGEQEKDRLLFLQADKKTSILWPLTALQKMTSQMAVFYCFPGSEADSDEDYDIDEKDDILEHELGDDDQVMSDSELRDQVGRVHLWVHLQSQECTIDPDLQFGPPAASSVSTPLGMNLAMVVLCVGRKTLIDDDKRQLRLYQERYLPDGDLHSEGGGRVRRFRWRNMGNAEKEMQLHLRFSRTDFVVSWLQMLHVSLPHRWWHTAGPVQPLGRGRRQRYWAVWAAGSRVETTETWEREIPRGTSSKELFSALPGHEPINCVCVCERGGELNETWYCIMLTAKFAVSGLQK